ncbi:hypothetical protein PVK06_035304 [Gossypium arboreum]|uniref:Uncharacterized protein n=1 Tax=Gossypium arboreum TaxID=29729 RepID=A0ABR0NHE7_GOSAR|nr:hypothetical protein PVK06_035304 [Gossypium arboreum]
MMDFKCKEGYEEFLVSPEHEMVQETVVKKCSRQELRRMVKHFRLGTWSVAGRGITIPFKSEAKSRNERSLVLGLFWARWVRGPACVNLTVRCNNTVMDFEGKEGREELPVSPEQEMVQETIVKVSPLSSGNNSPELGTEALIRLVREVLEEVFEARVKAYGETV